MPVLRTGLHEVELVVLEAEVGGEGVHQEAGGLLADVRLALLDQVKPVLAMARPSAGMRATLAAHDSVAFGDRVGVAHVGEQTEVLDAHPR